VRRVQQSEEQARRRQLQLNERPDSVAELQPGIYYVDLTRIGPSGLRGRLDTLARADGVVFDVRGYVEGGNQALLGHLASRPLQSMRFEVPQFIYPDQNDIVGYDASGRRTLSSRRPRISGTVAFLTDARAISRSETFLSVVEHYELGEIVGQPTAGANGPVNPFTLSGGYEVHWTGMRVRKHDGSQHHLVGIRPDVPAERTIEGVREGRDEALEKALRVLQRSQ
jgi:C-terminal processing protease CtpA/Prc